MYHLFLVYIHELSLNILIKIILFLICLLKKIGTQYNTFKRNSILPANLIDHPLKEEIISCSLLILKCVVLQDAYLVNL